MEPPRRLPAAHPGFHVRDPLRPPQQAALRHLRRPRVPHLHPTSRREILKLLAGVPLLPLLGLWRFGVLGPVSWLVPSLREYVLTRASSLTLDVEYRSRLPRPGAQQRSWLAQEAATTLVVWLAVPGFVSGLLPWQLAVAWAAVNLGIGALDLVRTLGAHRYVGDDEDMTLVEQMLDTFNYPHARWAAQLWGPVGLRLHALHHLFPGLPYHSLQEAHDRLVARLPEDSAYRLTESRGLLRSLVELWRTAGRLPTDAPSPQVLGNPGR